MHDQLSRLRRQQRRNATRQFGVSPDQDRVFSEQVAYTGQEAELLQLPTVPATYVDAGSVLVVGVGVVGTDPVA